MKIIGDGDSAADLDGSVIGHRPGAKRRVFARPDSSRIDGCAAGIGAGRRRGEGKTTGAGLDERSVLDFRGDRQIVAVGGCSRGDVSNRKFYLVQHFEFFSDGRVVVVVVNQNDFLHKSRR